MNDPLDDGEPYPTFAAVALIDLALIVASMIILMACFG